MPFYSFLCDHCGHNQDHLLKIGATLEKCPKCSSGSYSKQVTAPGGFAFKGGGFYQTDFKSPTKSSKQ